jgi:Putative zinc-finger
MFHAQRLINKHFVDGLSPADHARMRAHLLGCESCRREYDDTVELLRAAAGREPTRSELASWGDAIWARLDETGSAAAAAAATAPGSVSRWLMPALACAMLLLLCAGIWLAEPLRSDPEVQLRGATIGAPSAPLVTLEVFAIRPRLGGGFTTPRRLEEGDAVRLDTFLQFRYLNHASRIKHVYLLGLDRRRQPLDYFPRPMSGGRSISINQALSPRAVPRSIHLATRHRTGRLDIIALFSERALERAEVHQQLSAMQTGAKLGTIDFGSGVHAVVQQVLLVD